MKRIVAVAAIVVVLGVAATVAVALSAGRMIKGGIETVGTRAAEAPVTVRSVRISPFSGAGSLRGLVIGNPRGFRTESAFRVEEVRIAVDLASLAGDRIIVRDMVIDAPEITYEQGLTTSNIDALAANISAYAGVTSAPSPREPQYDPPADATKLQIDRFTLKNAKVRLGSVLTGKQPIDIPVFDVTLRDLGAGEQGMTAAETLAKLSAALSEEILRAVSAHNVVTDITRETATGAARLGEGVKRAGKATVDAGKKAGKAVQDATRKTVDGVRDLFRR